jgi:hypothetical protein
MSTLSHKPFVPSDPEFSDSWSLKGAIMDKIVF